MQQGLTLISAFVIARRQHFGHMIDTNALGFRCLQVHLPVSMPTAFVMSYVYGALQAPT